MNQSFIVIFITVPSIPVGKQVADALLEKKLAACVNIIPSIRSLYTWQGEKQDDEEALLVVKSRADLFSDGILPAVKAVHPYDVPEIIALPIMIGSQDYLDWIAQETSQ